MCAKNCLISRLETELPLTALPSPAESSANQQLLRTFLEEKDNYTNGIAESASGREHNRQNE